MCEFVSDRYNPIIAKVFGIILDIAEPEIDTLEVRNSSTSFFHHHSSYSSLSHSSFLTLPLDLSHHFCYYSQIQYHHTKYTLE